MTLKEKIAVMQAADEGKKIQRRLKIAPYSPKEWLEKNPESDWNWETFVFRVKPEPREWWEIRTGSADPHPISFPTRAMAEARIGSCSGNVELVHVREVLP